MTTVNTREVRTMALPHNFTFELDFNDSFFESGHFFYGESLISQEEFLYEPYQVPLYFIVILLCMYGIAIVISIGGNLLVCYTICTVRALRTVTNFFLASLSVSDILMTVICIPSTVLSNIIFHYWVLGSMMCPIIQFLQIVVVLQRAFAMVAITCDRHLVISRPLHKRMNKRSARLLILFLWVLAAIIALPPAIHSKIIYLPYEPGSKGLCIEVWANHRLRYVYSVAIMMMQYFLPLMIMTCAYVHIGYMIWIKRPPGEADKERDRRIASSKRKSLKMLFVVVSAYACTWLPLHVLTLIGDVDPAMFNKMYVHILWLLFHWLAFSNSGMNPIVYGWMNNTFRVRFKLFCIKIQCCGQTEQMFRHYSYRVNKEDAYYEKHSLQKRKYMFTSRKQIQVLDANSGTFQTYPSSPEPDHRIELNTIP